MPFRFGLVGLLTLNDLVPHRQFLKFGIAVHKDGLPVNTLRRDEEVHSIRYFWHGWLNSLNFLLRDPSITNTITVRS